MTVPANLNAHRPSAQLSLHPKYSQDWPSYNAAQVEQKSRFIELLADPCQYVPHHLYCTTPHGNILVPPVGHHVLVAG